MYHSATSVVDDKPLRETKRAEEPGKKYTGMAMLQ
jgi:hypothetical protein